MLGSRPRARTGDSRRRPPRVHAVNRTPARALALVVPAVFAAVVLFPARQDNWFSDGFHLTNVVADGAAYYHAFFVPTAAAVHRVANLFGEFPGSTTLAWHSALCTALAIGWISATLMRAGSTPGGAVLGSTLVLVTPATVFFGTVAEVHGLELLGAAIAWDLGWRARSASDSRAALLCATGLFVAIGAHLVNVLLAPPLLLLALSEPSTRSLRRAAGVAAAMLAGIALLFTAAWLAWLATRKGHHPAQMLDLFTERLLLSGFESRGFFTPLECLAFLDRELLRPTAFLLLGPPLALAFARPGRRALPLLVIVASLPFLVVLPQGGVREEGAYFLPLYPGFALCFAHAMRELLATRVRTTFACRAAALSLLALQALAADGRWSEFARAENAWDWTLRAEAVSARDGTLLTGSLPRQHIVATRESFLVAIDLRRELELKPRADWPAIVEEFLTNALVALQAGRPLYVDVELLDERHRSPQVAYIAERLHAAPLAFEPRPAAAPAIAAVTVSR